MNCPSTQLLQRWTVNCYRSTFDQNQPSIETIFYKAATNKPASKDYLRKDRVLLLNPIKLNLLYRKDKIKFI